MNCCKCDLMTLSSKVNIVPHNRLQIGYSMRNPTARSRETNAINQTRQFFGEDLASF